MQSPRFESSYFYITLILYSFIHAHLLRFSELEYLQGDPGQPKPAEGEANPGKPEDKTEKPVEKTDKPTSGSGTARP